MKNEGGEKDVQGLNYDTIVDSYLPPVPKVSTDQPLYPEQFVEEYELTQMYQKVCRKKFELE